MQTDRIRWETRLLGAVIVPFLVVAFLILYLRPEETARLFAWPIAPHMTSFLLASAYLGGAYFFVRVARGGSWHTVAVGFLPVTTFAALMMIATVVHWDRFTHSSVAFVVWTALYATTPFLVLGAWLRNRNGDASLPVRGVIMPNGVRLVMGATGVVVLVTGVFLFAYPEPLIAAWPWRLTALTARVIGACFALTAVFGISIAREPGWSAARIPLQSQALGVALILLGALRAWSELDAGSVFTWLFVAGMTCLLVAIAGLYAVLERRSRLEERQ